MQSRMIETMQQLPILQGLTIDDFNNIITHISLDFNTYEEGETIVHQGDSCTKLIYIIDGKFEVEYRNVDESFSLTETSVSTPILIEFHNLFSVKRTYECTYRFVSRGTTFTISKNHLTQTLLTFPIIRTNAINMLSSQLSKQKKMVQFHLPKDIGKRITAFIRSYTYIGTGNVKVCIGMGTLADLIDVTRTNVSKVLNQWNDEGLIELKRQSFNIPDITRLPQ